MIKKFLLLMATLSFLVSCTSGIHVDNQDASIGASIGVDQNGWLHLIHLVPDGPAAASKAILEGDRLVGIKTRPETEEFAMVHMLQKDEIIALIRGPKGTQVTLWLVRDFKSHYVTLTRAVAP